MGWEGLEWIRQAQDKVTCRYLACQHGKECSGSKNCGDIQIPEILVT